MGDGSGSLVPGEPFPKRHAGTVGRWSGPDGIPTLERGNENHLVKTLGNSSAPSLRISVIGRAHQRS